MQALRLRHDSVLGWLCIDQRVFVGASFLIIMAMTHDRENDGHKGPTETLHSRREQIGPKHSTT
jgi:hypothetical protein